MAIYAAYRVFQRGRRTDRGHVITHRERIMDGALAPPATRQGHGGQNFCFAREYNAKSVGISRYYSNSHAARLSGSYLVRGVRRMPNGVFDVLLDTAIEG
jgi:hypothetical protein